MAVRTKAQVAGQAAISQIGVPYRYAAEAPGQAFDCSGLTQWAWGKAGVSLPHNAQAQHGTVGGVDRPRFGDLVFYDFTGYISHVALYVGLGLHIDANHTGGRVKIRPVYRSNLVSYGRPAGADSPASGAKVFPIPFGIGARQGRLARRAESGLSPERAGGRGLAHRALTATEIANFARDAGFRDDRPSNDPTRASELATITAVALAESGGRWWVVNSIGATGLTQIYPGRDSLLDPAANLRAAWSKYVANDRRFGKGPASDCLWSAYCNRTYVGFLPRAERAVNRTHRGSIAPKIEHAAGDVIGTALNPLAGIPIIGDLFKGVKDTAGALIAIGQAFVWLIDPRHWARVAMFIGGVLLLIMALVVLMKPQIDQAVKQAAPAAKVAAVAA